MSWWTVFLLVLAAYEAVADVTPLDSSNFDHILQSNELVFVNFYADWCRFSQMLKPIFLDASNNFKERPAGQVAFASVDADKNSDIATKYHVNKYPTLKLFRNGEVTKKEYRSQRSVDSLTEYVTKQLEITLKMFSNQNDFNNAQQKEKRTVLGYFTEPSGVAFDNLKKISQLLRDDCDFLAGIGAANFPQDVQAVGHPPKLVFQPPTNTNQILPIAFTGNAENYEELKKWASEQCIPLIREITFTNAEELTEEGLPFLILFKHPDDKTSEKIFSEAVQREIPDQKKAVNCLVADGKKFAHPLHHLGKAEGDLPVIAIDSFRHMYLFSGFNDLKETGKLRQFVLDLHSGKLHREFHHGPDPVQQQENGVDTQPPPSAFEKLKPSDSRYTLLDKTEL